MASAEGGFGEFAELVLELEPMRGLSEKARQQILTSGAVMRLGASGILFRQGDNDPYAYWLVDGRLNVFSDEELVKSLEGGTPAAMQSVSRLRPRTVTAKAVSDAVVFRADQALVDKLVEAELGFADAAADVEF